jgi:hypothetical protein
VPLLPLLLLLSLLLLPPLLLLLFVVQVKIGDFGFTNRLALNTVFTSS